MWLRGTDLYQSQQEKQTEPRRRPDRSIERKAQPGHIMREAGGAAREVPFLSFFSGTSALAGHRLSSPFILFEIGGNKRSKVC